MTFLSSPHFAVLNQGQRLRRYDNDEYYDDDERKQKAKERAEQEIVGNARPNVMPLYGKMKNPVHLTGKQKVFEMGYWNDEDNSDIDLEVSDEDDAAHFHLQQQHMYN